MTFHFCCQWIKSLMLHLLHEDLYPPELQFSLACLTFEFCKLVYQLYLVTAVELLCCALVLEMTEPHEICRGLSSKNKCKLSHFEVFILLFNCYSFNLEIAFTITL